MRHDRISTPPAALRGPQAVADMLSPFYDGLACEALTILHLDRGFGLLRTGFLLGGESVALPIGRIAREATVAGARAVIVAHNHPGGDPTPSRADRRATCRLAEALRPLSVLLADHVVFGEGAWFSFHALGWL